SESGSMLRNGYEAQNRSLLPDCCSRQARQSGRFPPREPRSTRRQGGGAMRQRAIGVLMLGALAIASRPVSAAMTTEDRLRALENLVHQQQEEIKQLRGELKQQNA